VREVVLLHCVTDRSVVGSSPHERISLLYICLIVPATLVSGIYSAHNKLSSWNNKWVNPLQPSIRSAGQSFFSLLLCCCSSSGCNIALLWFPSFSWRFILLSRMASLLNGTFRSSCRVWLVTYQDAFVIIRSIVGCLRCILAICDLLAHQHSELTPILDLTHIIMQKVSIRHFVVMVSHFVRWQWQNRLAQNAFTYLGRNGIDMPLSFCSARL
jgi:hypothetical protein